MFKYIARKLSFLMMKNEYKGTNSQASAPSDSRLSSSLAENMSTFKNILSQSSDLVFREFSFGLQNQMKAVLIFIEGLSEQSLINETILKPFMYDISLKNMDSSLKNNIDIIEKSFLSVGNVKRTCLINDLVDSCLSGDTILMIDGIPESIIIYSKAWEGRGVEEPKTEAVVRGPREGFTENIAVNMSLIRRRIKSPDLTFKTLKIGSRTKTSVCIVYVKGIVNPKLIDEIYKRLNRINTDAILESGYIEQFIEDAPYSIFPTIGNTEKPDTSAAKILEGRACILVDGTPFALTVPMLFIEGFQSAEDYYTRPYFASLLRILRFACFTISILSPATYVMLATFHQELIPTTLLFTMAAGREGVPFPAVIEAGLMMITFEILREAGVRLPRPVGQAVSIVGALVIGEAAVTAGLVGGLLVIVVALTAVSSFVLPAFTDVEGILRIFFLILAGFLGIFGVGLGILFILAHIVSLRSFGTPYFAPMAPLTEKDLKDTFIRVPIWKMTTRPRTIGWHNINRQKDNLKPEPPKDGQN
ncbi:MAG: spore germination protein [Clostridiaceae bacterium]